MTGDALCEGRSWPWRTPYWAYGTLGIDARTVWWKRKWWLPDPVLIGIRFPTGRQVRVERTDVASITYGPLPAMLRLSRHDLGQRQVVVQMRDGRALHFVVFDYTRWFDVL